MPMSTTLAGNDRQVAARDTRAIHPKARVHPTTWARTMGPQDPAASRGAVATGGVPPSAAVAAIPAPTSSPCGRGRMGIPSATPRRPNGSTRSPLTGAVVPSASTALTPAQPADSAQLNSTVATNATAVQEGLADPTIVTRPGNTTTGGLPPSAAADGLSRGSATTTRTSPATGGRASTAVNNRGEAGNTIYRHNGNGEINVGAIAVTALIGAVVLWAFSAAVKKV